MRTARTSHRDDVAASAAAPPPAATPVLQRVMAVVDASQIRHHHRIPGRPAHFADWPGWVPDDVLAALARSGIDQPYQHQVEGAETAWRGESVVIATGTASGKSLAYLLPTLSALGDGGAAAPGATALYVSPTKALAADQLSVVDSLSVPGVRASTYDGDTSKEERSWARAHANYVLTNPDMLHHSLLPSHARWGRFFRGLRFVVIDECHHYRGVFGSHVANVLHRLDRVARHHGAAPTFVLASATVAHPAQTAARLVGGAVREVTGDSSHQPATDVLFLTPADQPGSPSSSTTTRSVLAEAANLSAQLVRTRTRGLTFLSSRKGVEAVAAIATDRLDAEEPGLGSRMAAYRGGYLPHERRALERDIRDGSIDVLAATSALELGVDITGLDVVVIAGWPGTRSAFWQRAGRAGRTDSDAVTVLVAGEDPLDRYLVDHPDAVLGEPTEATVLDPDNPYVLAPHLCAAAAEIPLRPDEVATGERRAVVESLEARGLLRRRPTGWFWTRREQASQLADIRGGKEGPVRIVEPTTGRMIGTVDYSSAYSTAHEGAVYQHQGETFVVTLLDLPNAVAFVERDRPDFTTTARSVSDVSILETEETALWGAAEIAFGTVEVTHHVTSYIRRSIQTGQILGTHPLDLPPRQLRTKACWWTIDAESLVESGIADQDLPGAAHAAEHAGIGMLPLLATCDRWDIGGVSTARHADTERLTVIVHDGQPGGAGFAERGYGAAATWWRATREAISVCRCDHGCPACVQSPKCGNGNEPLDKPGALLLLDLLLRDVPADAC